MSEVLSEACGLRFSYVDGLPILDGVDLEIRRGEVLLVGGESGKGKSTLLRLLLGLEKPMPDFTGSCRGQVFLFGEDCWDVPMPRLRELRQRTGFVFQGNTLISHMSVAENIAVPLHYHTKLTEREIDETVQRWVDNLLLTGHEDKRPAHLSLGMQRRAAMARAMAMNPEILFLDEPTAGLDVKNSEIFLSLVGNLRALSNVAILMVSHDLASARFLDGKIQLLMDGVLREPKTYDDISDSDDPRERELVRDDDDSRFV
ncbi:MAG: ATP-binding cassette domain-containing protein [Fibrobacterota bacterium]|nr:ATP-binding cassette domain-containing protein [Fibrobacterota bacterium]QQS06669.1 MAG: ATP-binding cassette domain-containing protein [Fibrobacterota bacterium]